MSFINFGFGKRRTYSSRLMDGAYAAGRRGRHGVRGDEHFEDWLDGQTERYPDLHSGFVGRLRAEYFRGVETHEEALKTVAERTEASKTFKGHRIEAQGEEFIVPSLDRESRFENVREAKRFIAALS